MFKKILSVVTILLVCFAGYKTFFSHVDVVIQEDGAYAMALEGDEPDLSVPMWEVTWHSLQRMNVWVLLLLIPEQILMYYSAAQIYFAFLRERETFKVSRARLTRISLEINFVNHALPSGGASGLAYLIWRLKELRVSAGQISFVHGLRYAICAVANTVQTFIAILIVMAKGNVRPEGVWAIVVAALIALGTQLLILAAILIVRKQKNIDWLSDVFTRGINKFVRTITGGRKRKILKEEKFERFFNDLRGDYLKMRKNRRILWRPIVWGAIFSFLELATYWVVGIALGHPEILPQIMIAEGVASVVGTVMPTPGGVGGYEAAMIIILNMTGVDISTATITVLVTRVCIMLGTFVSGWGFYQNALMKREDKFRAVEEIKGE